MPDPFVLFLAALAFFHTSEFCLAALYNRDGLGWRCEGRAALKLLLPPPLLRRRLATVLPLRAPLLLLSCSLAVQQALLHRHAGSVRGARR